MLPPGRAEDAVQHAFLNAYRAILDGESDLRLRPWLYRIAHNASLNLLRQNGWNYDQIPEDFDGGMQPPQAVATGTPAAVRAATARPTAPPARRVRRWGSPRRAAARAPVGRGRGRS